MKSLSTLIKLQKTFVDEQRLMLAQAQDRLTLIERNIADLEAQKKREQEAAAKDPQQAITYGDFLKEAIKRARILEHERQIAAAAVEAAHDRLSELFEEQKRYEIAEAARIAAEEKEAIKRETAELDEIGGIIHERNKGD